MVGTGSTAHGGKKKGGDEGGGDLKYKDGCCFAVGTVVD